MADSTPIPMGIPWDPWDPSLPHSHAHLYCEPQAGSGPASQSGDASYPRERNSVNLEKVGYVFVIIIIIIIALI